MMAATRDPALQPVVQRLRNVLQRFFYDALGDVQAQEGFLAFEDSNGYLSILVSEGQFWHLPTGQGVTGQAFKTGRPVIARDDQGVTTSRTDAPGPQRWELAVPIHVDDRVAGAMLFDRLGGPRFEGREESIAVRYANMIASAIKKVDPWSFHQWWIGHSSRKCHELVRRVADAVHEIVDQYGQHTWGFIGLVEQGEYRRGEPLSRTAPQYLRERPRTGVIASGEARLLNDPRVVYECIVPFPRPEDGPVVGLVELMTTQENLFTNETVARLQDAIATVRYDPLAPSGTSASHPEELYFGLNYRLLEGLHERTLVDALELVAEGAHQFCGGFVRLSYVPPDGSRPETRALDKRYAVLPSGEDELKRQFPEAGRRVRHTAYREGVYAAALWNGRHVAVVEVHGDRTVESFNGPIVQNVAFLVSKLLRRYGLETG